jgi:ATP-dependent helicase/nuclease subunit B
VSRGGPPRGNPHVFSIPAGVGFAEALAARLLTETAADPLALSAYRVLLPTRRAAGAAGDLLASLARPLLLLRLEPWAISMPMS